MWRLPRDLLAPPACLACGAPGDDLCACCRLALPWLPEPRCRRCALPGGCGRCPASGMAFTAAWAPVAYAGPAQALVAALKFRRLPVAAETMACAMAAAPAWLLGEAPVLVPVPTARTRVRARGFDQAQTLAAGVARCGLGPVQLCLERAGSASRQRGATRTERLAAGRIEITGRPGLAIGRNCVLVDDVHTTGATLDVCARVLLEAGAERVVALTYARALA